MKLVLNGILLSKIDYSESSLILKFFTREEGLVSFLFQGGKKKKGNALFPLSKAEINCYKRSDSSLSKISSIDISTVNQELFFDPIRFSIIFFVAEICTLTIKNEEEDLALFQYLEKEIDFIQRTKEFTNYPIYFLLAYSKYLGFYPQNSPKALFFDLEEGECCAQKPTHPNFYDQKEIELYTIGELNPRQLKKTERNKLLNMVLNYYSVQLGGLPNIKSKAVLEVIFE